VDASLVAVQIAGSANLQFGPFIFERLIGYSASQQLSPLPPCSKTTGPLSASFTHSVRAPTGRSSNFSAAFKSTPRRGDGWLNENNRIAERGSTIAARMPALSLVEAGVESAIIAPERRSRLASALPRVKWQSDKKTTATRPVQVDSLEYTPSSAEDRFQDRFEATKAVRLPQHVKTNIGSIVEGVAIAGCQQDRQVGTPPLDLVGFLGARAEAP
jgi:hypothetical protein